ncbi:MAG: ROK family transcriptional regulator [Pseudomonadota bacterium]
MLLPSANNESTGKQTVDPSGGANQVRVRAYNERLVLSLVRRHEALAKADIARRTGLSAQTVSVIMRSLESEGLLLKGAPQRGKVGQPSVPMTLNPAGAFALGVKIGRRSADLVLVDFLGEIRNAVHTTYRWAEPESILGFISTQVGIFLKALNATERQRLCGIGVAMPFELWNWPSEAGAPVDRMEVWRDFHFGHRLAEETGLIVHVLNDATSACGAELAFGLGTELSEFVYFYIATFVGGGIVLNHTLYPGRNGSAGALGSMPVQNRDGSLSQLIHHASIAELERRVQSGDEPVTPLWRDADDWSSHREQVDAWLQTTARHLAIAIVSSCAVIDFQAAVLDGAFPADVRDKLVGLVDHEIGKLDCQGIRRPQVIGGTIGQNARAIGGASLALSDRYFLDPSVLFKELS